MRIATSSILTSLLLGGLALGLASGGAHADTVPLKLAVPHITVTGSAMTDVVPDEAYISLGVVMERPTSSAAANEMAKAATAVVAEIKAQGVETADVKTTSTSLYPIYEDHDQAGHPIKRVLRGYQASEDLTIRIRDVAKASTIARALIDKGANEFHSITFSYSKRREKMRALQSDAMRDALNEAQSYTNAIGLKLGRVIQIGDDSDSGGAADLPARPMAPGAFARKAAAPSVAIPVEPGTQTLTSTIAVTWEIESGH